MNGRFPNARHSVNLETQSWRVETIPVLPPVDSIDFSTANHVDVISLKSSPQKLKIKSFSFAPISTAPIIGKSTPKKTPARPPKSNPSRLDKPASRMHPPKDVIKLQDRLFYMLQPPMESLVGGGQIEFPFEPFNYQYEGIAFLFPRHAAILADEMGLGKTMQAITTIRLLLRNGELQSILLVCPKPLVPNWQREFQLWAPEIGINVIEGSHSRRQFQWGQKNVPVTIANYELVARDQAIVNSEDIAFDLVVLDEAQRIKNKNSCTSKVVRNITRSRSWAMTGTPVENSHEDIVGIFEFLHSGYLTSEMSPRRISGEVRDYIIRRTKDQVLTDMPPKLVRDAELHLTAEQALRYEQAENAGVIKLNELGAEITIQHVFELVLRLKQICNFDPLTGCSSKMDMLQADLEEVASSGQKAIVFSQWVKSLDEIENRLAAFNPLAYHGRIPSKKREGILAEFKQNPERHVLLMSYGAGSVGLNLQFCRYVFLFDRWWNPAVEDQAINRAHRIGAAGSVTVTRMLAIGTIEERINQILEEKRQLFDSILSNTDQPANLGLSRKEILGLFDFQTNSPSVKDVA